MAVMFPRRQGGELECVRVIASNYLKTDDYTPDNLSFTSSESFQIIFESKIH